MFRQQPVNLNICYNDSINCNLAGMQNTIKKERYIFMDLGRLYSDIMRRGQNSVLSGKEYVDKTIGDYSDTRMGLTLVIRPTIEIQNEMVIAIYMRKWDIKPLVQKYDKTTKV